MADDSKLRVGRIGDRLTVDAVGCRSVCRMEGTQDDERYAHLFAASEDILDALALALPYVEEAERDPAYKPGVVKQVVRKMRAAIERTNP